MRRLLPALLIAPLLLTGCIPGADGGGDDAMSDEELRAIIAAGDEKIERSLWAAGELEEALGGAEAADEVFDGLFGSLADFREHVETEATAEDFTIEAASMTQVGSTEADGAGGFLAMVLSKIGGDLGIAATADGKTKSGYKDLSDKTSQGGVSIETLEDGTIQSRLETHGTYKGAKIDIVVGNDIKPCPDASGLVEPRAVFQLNLTGPSGAGTSTQIVIDMQIQLDDDAGIASSEHQYEATYSARPQTEGASVFDFSTKSVTFTRDLQGGHAVSDLSVAGFWDAKFADEAQRTADYLSQWVANSTKEAAQKGWEDGRCIDLQGAYSVGPKGLKPKATVTATLTPIAKSDGAPAGGTVTAQLASGVKGIKPEGSKVKAPADFTYTAGDKKDESGTVRFESRSKRGVGILEVTFDTKEQSSYFMKGGGGDFYGTGFICDLNTPWQIEGSGVVMKFSPASDAGGSYSYQGNMGGVSVYGGEAYEVVYKDGVAVSIHGWGVGTVETGGYSASGPGDEYYELAPIERPPGCD